jgi:hypothetical protein
MCQTGFITCATGQRLWSIARSAAVLCGLTTLLVVILRFSPAAPPQATSQAPPNPVDEPLRLVSEARQAFQGVKDYTCLLVSRERIQGELQPENVVSMYVRQEPFSIYMRWQAPKALEDQEVCHVAGRNNGMMRVHSSGLLGLVGFVNLDPRDPRVFEHSRHDITEAGIGHLNEQYDRYWQAERPLHRLHVACADYEFDHRWCTRVEASYPGSKPGEYYAYRSVIYFDREHHLPIRVENYGWPRPGGPSGGDLLESYSHVALRLNVNLADQVFSH